MSTTIELNRSRWVWALTAHPPEILLELVEQLSHNWDISYETLPQSGLFLLQVQDSVFYEPYYLGEIPVSSAWVRLTAPDGRSWQGAAQVMSDHPQLATALAICDAILAHQLAGWQQVAAVLEKGQALRQHQEHIRGAMLAKTRVNFSLLSQEATDDLS